MTALLPHLDDRYDLAPEAVAAYRKSGHVLLRGVARPDEVAAFRPVVASAVTRFNRESRPLADRDTYGRAFLQVMNLWREDADVRRFVLAARFAAVAADLLGAESVRIYHDQALVKEQVLAAGFKLAVESDILRNPSDTGEKNVFDPSLRGHTDQFVFKFVKPN